MSPLRRFASWLLDRVVAHVDGDRDRDAAVRVHDERADLDGWCAICGLGTRTVICAVCEDAIRDQHVATVAIDPSAMRERAEARKRELD